MMSQYIEQMIKERENEDICFLWISIGKGGLHKQSFNSLKKNIFLVFQFAIYWKKNFLDQEKRLIKMRLLW